MIQTALKGLFVCFVVLLFASLGWRGVTRDGGEAILLLLLFLGYFWREGKLFPSIKANWFLGAFLLFAAYGLLQVFAHPDLSFVVREHALRFPCYFIAAWLAFYFAQKETSLHFLLSSVSLVSAAFAILITTLVLRNLNYWSSQEIMDLGLSGRFWPSQWLTAPFFGSWVSYYFNVNTLSYFFELTAFLPLGLLFHRVTGLWEKGRRWSIGGDPAVLVWAVVFFSITRALVVFLSRGALIAFSCGFVLFLAFLAFKRSRWIALVLLCAIGALCWFGIQRTGELQTIPEDVSVVQGLVMRGTFTPRVEAWQTLTRIFISHLWLGSGPGSYPVLYFAYKPYSALPFSSRQGYNDALELLAELGIIGAVLFIVVTAAYLFYLIRTIFSSDKQSLLFSASSAITCGIAAVFFHSLVASGLQYFPVGCLTALLAGACMGACYRGETGTYGRKTLMVFIIVTGTIFLGLAIFRWWIMPWRELPGNPLENAQKRVQLDPTHPDHRAQLGDLFLYEAMNSKTSNPKKMNYLEQARQEYEMIKKLNPYSFEYYGKTAQLYIEQRDYAAAVKVLQEWETAFPNAVDAKVETTLYYLEMAARDKPKDPEGSAYFDEAKEAVERARTHHPAFDKLKWHYWKRIYERFHPHDPGLLKAIAKSGLLQEK